MGQLSLAYFLNGRRITFTKCNNSWYFSASELSAFGNVAASEYVNSADTRAFIDTLSDYMDLPKIHIITNDFEDQPGLGVLLINEVAMDYVQRYCPDILSWICDRMTEFDIYEIPFDNVPLTTAARKRAYDKLTAQSMQEYLAPRIKKMITYCADIFKD